MAALIQVRNTPQMGPRSVIEEMSIPVKGTFKLYQGGIAAIDSASGYAKPGATATGLVAVGVALKTADNTSGSDGAINVSVRQGVFKFGNSGGADTIAAGNVGSDCFIVDDQTVALTDANGTRSFAGRIVQVDSDGVWVQMGLHMSMKNLGTNPKCVIAIPMDLPTLANTQSYTVTPKFGGRILGASFTVRKPATTAAKAATLTAQVGGVALGGTGGGVVSLTSANCTPAGAEIAGSAIGSGATGNTFASGTAIGFSVSGVTAFVEGDGTAFLHLG